MNYARVLDPNVIGRMNSDIVEVRLNRITEVAPNVELEMILMLSAQQASTVAEDLAMLGELPPAGRLDA